MTLRATIHWAPVSSPELISEILEDFVPVNPNKRGKVISAVASNCIVYTDAGSPRNLNTSAFDAKTNDAITGFNAESITIAIACAGYLVAFDEGGYRQPHPVA